MVVAARSRHETKGFWHAAMVYAGEAGFVRGSSDFLRAGVAVGEPALVVVSAEKIRLLREALGAEADHVLFADMAAVGANPAHIIPAWRDFVDAQPVGAPFRGIGEPIWSGRPAAELIECQKHEALLNVAFAHSPAWALLCPYDVGSLTGAVLDEAFRSHPYVVRDGIPQPSDAFRGIDACEMFDDPLAPPPPPVAELGFDGASLSRVRQFVRTAAESAGVDVSRAQDVALAAHEVATNSIKYGGGAGTLRVWCDDGVLVCEVSDGGHLHGSLAGRVKPSLWEVSGRGLWLTNQLCDLVQLRTSPAGTTVRIHTRLR